MPKEYKAADLLEKLNILEYRIRKCENPDGTCPFDAEKVFIFLVTAIDFVPDPDKPCEPDDELD